MKRLIAICSLVLLSGCTPTHTVTETVNEEGVGEKNVEIAVTRKGDLGEALIHTSDHRFYLYDRSDALSQKTYYFGIVKGDDQTVSMNSYRTLVEFNENGVAKRAVMKKCGYRAKKKNLTLCGYGNSTDLLIMIWSSYGDDLATRYQVSDNLRDWEQLLSICYKHEQCKRDLDACIVVRGDQKYCGVPLPPELRQ